MSPERLVGTKIGFLCHQCTERRYFTETTHKKETRIVAVDFIAAGADDWQRISKALNGLDVGVLGKMVLTMMREHEHGCRVCHQPT